MGVDGVNTHVVFGTLRDQAARLSHDPNAKNGVAVAYPSVVWSPTPREGAGG